MPPNRKELEELVLSQIRKHTGTIVNTPNNAQGPNDHGCASCVFIEYRSRRFAITCEHVTRDSQETTRALNQGFRFVLERPLTTKSIQHTLRVAYGLIVRERRRYFRYSVSVPVVFSSEGEAKVCGRTINISEGGLAISSLPPLKLGGEGTIQFTLPDPSVPITAQCRVCWNKESGDAGGNAGLAFVSLPFEVASELQRWLAQKLEGQLPPRA